MKIVSRIGIGDISKIIKTNKTKKHFIRREKGARFMGGYLYVSEYCKITLIKF